MNSTQAWPPDKTSDKISPVKVIIIDKLVLIMCHRDSATSIIVWVLLLAHPMMPCFATKTSSLKCPLVKNTLLFVRNDHMQSYKAQFLQYKILHGTLFKQKKSLKDNDHTPGITKIVEIWEASKWDHSIFSLSPSSVVIAWSTSIIVVK